MPTAEDTRTKLGASRRAWSPTNQASAESAPTGGLGNTLALAVIVTTFREDAIDFEMAWDTADTAFSCQTAVAVG